MSALGRGLDGPAVGIGLPVGARFSKVHPITGHEGLEME
jgi:hypothetical protein